MASHGGDKNPLLLSAQKIAGSGGLFESSGGMGIRGGVVLFILFAALSGVSCGRENLNPLYAPSPIQIKDPVIHISSDIELTQIPENAVKSFFGTIFDWIPVVGHLYEIPLDLLTVVLPTLSADMVPGLPEGADWRDPRLLRRFKSIKLLNGSIRAPGEKELTPRLEKMGKTFKGRKCAFLFLFCENEGIDFLKELRVYIVFGKDLRCMDRGDCADPIPNSKEVLMASAEIGEGKPGYSQSDDGTETVNFKVESTNLRPFLDQYSDFRVKILADGKPPAREAWIEGKFQIELILKN